MKCSAWYTAGTQHLLHHHCAHHTPQCHLLDAVGTLGLPHRELLAGAKQQPTQESAVPFPCLTACPAVTPSQAALHTLADGPGDPAHTVFTDIPPHHPFLAPASLPPGPGPRPSGQRSTAFLTGVTVRGWGGSSRLFPGCLSQDKAHSDTRPKQGRGFTDHSP